MTKICLKQCPSIVIYYLKYHINAFDHFIAYVNTKKQHKYNLPLMSNNSIAMQ